MKIGNKREKVKTEEQTMPQEVNHRRRKRGRTEKVKNSRIRSDETFERLEGLKN